MLYVKLRKEFFDFFNGQVADNEEQNALGQKKDAHGTVDWAVKRGPLSMLKLWVNII